MRQQYDCPRRWGIKIISTPLGKSVYFCSVELQERVLFYFPFGFISLLLLLLRISFTFRFGLVFHFSNGTHHQHKLINNIPDIICFGYFYLNECNSSVCLALCFVERFLVRLLLKI